MDTIQLLQEAYTGFNIGYMLIGFGMIGLYIMVNRMRRYLP